MKRIVSIWLKNFPLDTLEWYRRRSQKQTAPASFASPLEDSETHAVPRPFALVSIEAGGVRIAAPDPIAEAAGIKPGMRLADARALVPDLATCEVDADAHARLLTRLADWATRYTPHVAIDGEDGLWLDVTGATHLFGGEKNCLRDLSARLARLGFRHHAALAATPGAAHAAARFAGATYPAQARTQASSEPIVIPQGKDAATLAHLPVEALRLAPETIYMLHRFGLRHIGALRAMPRSALKRRFPSRETGDAVLLRLDQAHGEICEPIVPRVPSPAYIVQQPFPEPLLATESFTQALADLLARLTRLMEADGKGATRLTFAVWHADGGVSSAGIATARASRDPDHLARLFREKIETINPGFGVDLAELRADVVEPLRGAQIGLGNSASAASATSDPRNRTASAEESVTALVDRLVNRLGAQAVQTITLAESHVPEHAETRHSVLDRPPGASHSTSTVRRPVASTSRKTLPDSQQDASASIVSDLMETPSAFAAYLVEAEATRPIETPLRPIRLLERPEQVQVVAEVPEGPPRQFIWRRQVHRVLRAEGPERISPEWWLLGLQKPGADARGEERRSTRHRTREYYRFEDTDG
ncbi:MAG: DNA polymerase Y family protein, partial [Pseudomonadota bacterium]